MATVDQHFDEAMKQAESVSKVDAPAGSAVGVGSPEGPFDSALCSEDDDTGEPEDHEEDCDCFDCRVSRRNDAGDRRFHEIES
jgi:hypothetical protein